MLGKSEQWLALCLDNQISFGGILWRSVHTAN
jgi:hypothetical protein